MPLLEKKALLRENVKYLAAVLGAEICLGIMRLRAHGMYHAQLCRIHDMFNLQLIMCVFSVIIYIRIKDFICLSVYVHFCFFLSISAVLEIVSSRLASWPDSFLIFRSAKFNTALSLSLALFLTIYGFAVTRSAPVVNRVNVRIQDLPESLHGFTIVLLTDIHVGPTVDRKRVEKIVAKTNALQPDMVAIAGDLVDGFLPNLAPRAMPLANLKSKYGTYFATGNHEYYHGDVDAWLNYFKSQLNFTVLHNSHRDLCTNSDDCLCVAGVDDFYTERLRIAHHHMDAERALEGCDDAQPVVLLVHQPNGAKKIVQNTKKRIDLILSAPQNVAASFISTVTGHTHGGQFYIMWLIAYLKNAFLYGHYQMKNSNTQIYVSPGVNYWGPPVKMLNLCEITLLTLHA
ncbi:unnamed protein product [Gongylonema pulchrum]|uniref:Metallophos domain-containing protein n=1 Tax=Gongylonema pulchrum TaxID=637853 RepID=A0A183CUL3_9BILA|nr:unnamed protein product [Gongylonema pulchrum]